jgi:hypothetical protein
MVIKMQKNEMYQGLSFVNNYIALINVFVWRDIFLMFLNAFICCVFALKIYYPNHTTTKVISTVGVITIFLVFAFRIFF